MESQSYRKHFIQHLYCLCCYKQWSKHSAADKKGANMLHSHTNVLICCNSSHTVQRHNQVLSPSCQSQCSPKLFMGLYFIYDYIFPCHLKVRKSQFAGRNRAAKTFHRGRAAFISHAGWESCGIWGSYSADKPYHLYIASIMLRSWIIFYMQNIRTVIWENSRSRPAPPVIAVRWIRVMEKTRVTQKTSCKSITMFSGFIW